jgi:putative ABC transport system permease protein
MIRDYIKLAVENIFHKKVRSWLTVLGIFIGIAAVVALISLGQGLQYTVDQQFEKLGTDQVIVQAKGVLGAPGSDSGNTQLTKTDYDAIKRAQGVKEVMERLSRTAKIEFNKKTKFTTVHGLPLDETMNVIDSTGILDVDYGRKLRAGDKNKIIIGPEIAKEKIFGKPIEINDKLSINGEEFTVVGIIKTGNNPGISNAIIMPLDDARTLYDEADEISIINVKINDALEIDKTIDNIKRSLRKSRSVKEGKEDFTVQSTKKFVESFLVIFNVITTLLVGLASISLLVGAIGIANTMYTAVLERTREIGIMKSIGAKNSDILKIFLIESSLIGLIGGIIGVILGAGISKTAEVLIGNFLGEGFFQVFLPWWLIVGAVVFAVVIGTLSGILPARQAAGMNPVDALRQ